MTQEIDQSNQPVEDYYETLTAYSTVGDSTTITTHCKKGAPREYDTAMQEMDQSNQPVEDYYETVKTYSTMGDSTTTTTNCEKGAPREYEEGIYSEVN